MNPARLSSIFAASIGAVVLSMAWTASAQIQTAEHAPDRAHGAVIAAQGTAAGAPACAQCHAFNGVADGSGASPRIAGQSAHYLAMQLQHFASGIRDNPLMSPVAKALAPNDIADVSAYYAAINAPFLPLPTPNPTLIIQGEKLAKVGNEARQIPACNNCHGPGGAGEPPAIPYLAGQYASYIALELQMWRRGFRKSSPEEMAPLSHRLTEEDIAAVAAYYQQVQGFVDSDASHRTPHVSDPR
ncbi:c-type cytochrome [Bradyrhizobium tropiciagri]|uniref:c-type cytochrome n=1 Tax=Bradyrhizobium tropiciagri TaxID=312253 RepID=UPI000B03C8FF|nr:c-type cytochrome [Bradyrhizobium tropiciagri]